MRILLLLALVLALGGCETEFEACTRRGLKAFADENNEYTKRQEQAVFRYCTGSIYQKGRNPGFGRR